jgi:hypothetical protein
MLASPLRDVTARGDWRNVMHMLLPGAQSWPVRCVKCRHTGTVTAATTDLATKQLRCGTRQSFTPESVVRAPRRPNGRKVREARRAQRTSAVGKSGGTPTSSDPLLNDRLDDLVFAG